MQTKSAKLIFLSALLMLILAACGGTTPVATNPPAAEPTQVEATAISANPTEPQPIATDAPANPTDPEPIATDIPADRAAVSFSQDVLPILEANCTRCHGSSRQSDGLAVNTYAALLEGSSAGAVVIPSDAAGSKLVEVIVNGSMPRGGAPLTAEQIQIISDWINAGALDN